MRLRSGLEEPAYWLPILSQKPDGVLEVHVSSIDDADCATFGVEMGRITAVTSIHASIQYNVVRFTGTVIGR